MQWEKGEEKGRNLLWYSIYYVYYSMVRAGPKTLAIGREMLMKHIFKEDLVGEGWCIYGVKERELQFQCD